MHPKRWPEADDGGNDDAAPATAQQDGAMASPP